MAAKSSVFEHFEMPARREGVYKAKCKYCSVSISAIGTTTSNLLTHIKRKHSFHHPQALKKKKRLSQICDRTPLINDLHKTKNYSPSELRQIRISKSIALFVAGTFQSLSVVEADEFVDMIKSIDPNVVIPSRKHLSTNVFAEMFINARGKLIEKLAEATELSLMVYIMSGKEERNFAGIIAHFISDWKLNTALLDCKRYKERHTANAIMTLYEGVVNDFNISHKVIHITTDKACKVVKCFSIPGYKDYVDNNTVRKTYASDSESDLEEDGLISNHPSDNAFEFLPRYYSCFAFTLQLVVKDGIKEIISLSDVISKASDIVSHVRKSEHEVGNLKNRNRHQNANAIRWNFQLKQIRLMLDISQSEIDALTDVYKLSLWEYDLLKALCDILGPFETAVDFIQEHQTITSGFVIPCVRSIKMQLGLVSKRCHIQASSKVRKIINVFIGSVEKHFNVYELDPDFKIAAMLDPRFKLAWCQNEEAASLRILLQNEVASFKSVQTDSQSFTSKSLKTHERSVKFTRDTHSGCYEKDFIALGEITKYFSESCLSVEADPLKYWEVYSSSMPVLSRVALKYLAIPATSAPAEKLFNSAGSVFKLDKCRLADKRFENLMFLKCNNHLKC